MANRTLEQSREYYRKNTELVKAIQARYRLRTLAQAQARVKAYRLKYPERRAASEAKRRAAKLNATPIWANQFFIEETYDLAKRRSKATGIEWEVDHTVPLQSDIVCGLHTHDNLRVIPKFVNISKGNRYWPDMPT